jgi:two-component sensor histidine kinase
VALTLNELLTNAIKHGQGGELRCELAAQGESIRLRVVGRAFLPAGFELDLIRGGVSGLGLVRALLPRRSATLTLLQSGDEVVAQVELRPLSPEIRRRLGAEPDESGGQQGEPKSQQHAKRNNTCRLWQCQCTQRLANT